MSESVSSTVSNPRSAEQGFPSRQAPPVPADSSASITKALTSASEKAQQAAPEKTTQPAAASNQAPLVGNASSLSLQFRVDDKTKDVTVFVVDRSSKKVLRTIPSSELSKLQAGDLLKLTA